MPIEDNRTIEQTLADSMERFLKVRDANAAIKAAASLPEPDVAPRTMTLERTQPQGPRPGQGQG
jgi:hypothetical protein